LFVSCGRGQSFGHQAPCPVTTTRRNQIEIMVGRLKNRRRIATRYDRHPNIFLSDTAPAAVSVL
jgi:transposase